MLESIIPRKVASRRGYLAFLGFGAAGAMAISFSLMKAGDMRAKLPKTITPEWEAATEEYRKFHKMDPISGKY